MKDFIRRSISAAFLTIVFGTLLAGCDGDDDNSRADTGPALEREHDGRTFTPVVPNLTALPEATVYTGTYDGIHGPAAYAIEVPDDWNGILVMYAHGYRGTGPELTVSTPARIRNYLIENGYAWAASSYSANYYDVRAGLEDTNALAQAFDELTGNAHGQPVKYYIVGHSMGGHIAGAAVEAETLATARNVVEYSAALPLCGVMADMAQFDYLNDYTLLAQYFAGYGPDSFPATDFQERLDDIKAALFTDQTTWNTTAQGDKFKAAVRSLSGGERPIFDYGFHSSWQERLLELGGSDGTISGILASVGVDNSDRFYDLDGNPNNATDEEIELNANIVRVHADPNANPIRDDGVRWVPVIHGRFNVPVLTLHTLGDPYVPFVHQQKYRRAAIINGSDEYLVQWAIRSPSHCDFTVAEEVAAFSALAQWEQHGIKPTGDDVLDPNVVSDPEYGCTHTNNTTIPGIEDELGAVRAMMPACP